MKFNFQTKNSILISPYQKLIQNQLKTCKFEPLKFIKVCLQILLNGVHNPIKISVILLCHTVHIWTTQERCMKQSMTHRQKKFYRRNIQLKTQGYFTKLKEYNCVTIVLSQVANYKLIRTKIWFLLQSLSIIQNM